jgi:hypothetical protein
MQSIDKELLHRKFSFSELSQFLDSTTKDLQNYVARGLLKNVGAVPPKGSERTFSLIGVYEVAVLEALNKAGYLLPVAAQIIQSQLGLKVQSVVRELTAKQLGATLEGVPFTDAMAKWDQVFQAQMRVVEDNAARVLNGKTWLNRKLSEPVLWVISLDINGNPHVTESFGFGALAGKVLEARKLAWQATILLTSVARGSQPPQTPEPTDEQLANNPSALVFDLTAVLNRTDIALTTQK